MGPLYQQVEYNIVGYLYIEWGLFKYVHKLPVHFRHHVETDEVVVQCKRKFNYSDDKHAENKKRKLIMIEDANSANIYEVRHG